LDLRLRITSIELRERDFRRVESRPGELPAGSCIELSWNGERLLTDGIDPEIDALDDGPATSRSARRIRSEARMPDST
jgi:hypothetical protein